MTEFRVCDLPSGSAFLSGRGPVDPEVGVETSRLQVYYRRADDLRPDERAHAHEASDELFIVLEGSLVAEVEGSSHIVGPRQFCHFPIGVFHRIVRVVGPLEALVIRAPSVDDKVYRTGAGDGTVRT